ncbi:ABC transporter substrate-binding protein [Xenophilus arseniciresistens]|uniref:ABC transporter substrate-binding protein n=1 Tax=Xenophilus arseniciresistens TaxID=1283306 RepID=A0AAE3T1D0_9BURK|nr:ABC transporter substrate-binding protein [Xenophilus arseniciresistens]MDA7417247.1 ABC transporter substrate-binding protein [Xenophilus arseniciresistens]
MRADDQDQIRWEARQGAGHGALASSGHPRRRTLLRGAALACAAPPLLLGFQGVSAQTRAGSAPAPRVTQLLDMSPSQQELSRDYSTGLRLAFAQLKEAQPQLPQLTTVETDGSPGAVAEALRAVAQDGSQLALLGTVGETTALHAMDQIQRQDLRLAHIGPWLFDTRHDADTRLLTFLASREQQLRYAMQSLAAAGVGELALVYPDARMAQDMAGATQALVTGMAMKMRVIAPAYGQGLQAFASRLPAATPFHLVFMGTSVELAEFVRGLGAHGMQRIVVCLTGVDPNTFTQLVPDNRVPVVFTQGVPNPRTGRVPLVLSYRQALARYFDEAPSPVSLAGYVVGRYAAQMFARLGSTPTRAQVLTEVQQRRAVGIDEWPLAFDKSGRGSAYVAQMLLNTRGKFVGS